MWNCPFCPIQAGEQGAGANAEVMDFRRIMRDLDEAGRSLIDGDRPHLDDKADGYQLTVSARDFSRATRKVVDEKLTFSAALLRAGEINEAQRILAEVEHDVRNEEAALIEKVNEVSAKRAVTRTQMTRLRLVRLLATAMVGAGLLGVSAMGMALAGMFDAREKGHHQKKDQRNVQLAQAGNAQRSKRVVLGGMKVKLSQADLATFRRLTTGSVDARVLEQFLVTDLDLPQGVVNETIASVLSLTEPVLQEAEAVVSSTTETTEAVAEIADDVKKKAKDGASTDVDQPAEDEPAQEPTEEPTDDETPQPEAEKKENGSGGGDGDGDGQRTGVPIQGL